MANILLRFILFLTYWLLICQLPDQIPSPQLDPSWAGALSYFTDNRFQFGVDIIFTFGPLGYIYPNFYSGHLLTEKIVYELLLKAVIAFQLVEVSTRAGKCLGIVFFMLVLLMSHSIKDYLFHFSITFALMSVIESVQQRWRLFGWLAFLAVLSLIKFSFLTMILLGIASITLYLIIERDWQSLFLVVALYAATFIGAWALVGQNIFNLYHYLFSGIQISAGYQKSMFYHSATAPLIVGVLMLIAAAIFLCGLWAYGKRETKTTFGLLIFVQGLLLSWKHGFVRAEFYHIIQFYFFVPLALVSAWAVLGPSLQLHRKRLGIILGISLPLPYLGMLLGGSHYWRIMVRPPAWKQFQSNLNSLTDIQAYRHLVHEQLQLTKAKHELPKIKSLVGRESIDVFGFEQAIALLNDFNYRPRPVFQSYSAYNSFLIEANKRYYLQQDAPRYVLLKLQTIDDRLPSADDSGALEMILQNYTPVVAERGYLLMHKDNQVQIDVPRRLIANRAANFNDRIDLPSEHGRLWIQIEWDLSLHQILDELLLQPGETNIELVYEGGRKRTFRLTKPLASAGFLLSPILEDTYDVIEIITGGKQPKKVKSFRLISPVVNANRQFRYKLYAAPVPPIRTFSSDDALHQLRYWLFDRAPRRVEASAPPGVPVFRTIDLFMAPAPSEIVFDVPKDARVIEGFFGLQHSLILGRDYIDEAEFFVELIKGDQHPIELFHRHLKPETNSDQVGKQPFRALLPENASGQVRLRATIPPNSDEFGNRTYWSDIRFK